MRPLLAQTYEPHRVTFPCFVQPKLNGVRALYQTTPEGGRFQSRDEIPFPPGLLQHLAKPLQDTFDESIVLDGELYCHGWPLQRILGAVTPVRQEPTEDTLKIEFHVFDVVNFNIPFGGNKGTTYRLGETAQEIINYNNTRVCIVHKIFSALNPEPGIKGVATYFVDTKEQADSKYAEFVSQGYEGMMYRLGDCPYTRPKQPRQPADGVWRTKFLSDKDNRVWHLLKRKDWQDETFLFESINATIGDQGFPGFQMWLRTPSGSRFKVSSGLTRAQVEHYLIPENQPSQVKIKFLVYSEDGIPLNATVEAMI